MNFPQFARRGAILPIALVLAGLGGAPAHATIAGLKSQAQTTPGVYNFTAKTGPVNFPDGGAVTVWGFANNEASPWGACAPVGWVNYPGPTLIVNQGETITINLSNELPEPISLIFPGLGDPEDPVYAVPGDRSTLRSLAHEVMPGGPAQSYTFTASRPGTFSYQSGTNLAKQTYMGLFGAIIVRPAGYNEVNVAGNNAWTLQDLTAQDPPLDDLAGHTLQQALDLTRHAFGSADPDPSTPGADLKAFDSRYQREYLFIFHEIDPAMNESVAAGIEPDFTHFKPRYWTLNGRGATDTLFGDGTPWLPTQPYGSLAQMHPGERVLARWLSMGRDPHPFHPHTNHVEVLAHNGNVLSSAPANPAVGIDLAQKVYTLSVYPGQSYDTIFEWSAANLGWDIYGHATADSGQACDNLDGNLAPFEDPDDHCKPLPTQVPDPNNTAFGGFWSGSPFMGSEGSLPPGEGGLNPWAGFVAIWHSHAERELTNFDIFPGGIITFMIQIPYQGPVTTIPY